MKKFINDFFTKVPLLKSLNGIKTVLGLALGTYAVPATPDVVPVYGVPVPAKAIVIALAGFLTGGGIVHKKAKEEI